MGNNGIGRLFLLAILLAALVAAAAIFFIASCTLLFVYRADAATLRLSVHAPSTNDDGRTCGVIDSAGVLHKVQNPPGSVLTDLSEIWVYGIRLSDPSDTLLEIIPALGLEGQDIDFDMDIEDGNHVLLWTAAVDRGGNRSCFGSSYLVAVPATEAVNPGLLGSYYEGTLFQVLRSQRTDPSINFSWVGNAPVAGMPIDGWSVRWEGLIDIPMDGDWTFYVQVEDGARVSIDGVQIIDGWVLPHGGELEFSGTKALLSGKHPIQVEFFDFQGWATCRLLWSGPGLAKQVVPAGVFTH